MFLLSPVSSLTHYLLVACNAGLMVSSKTKIWLPISTTRTALPSFIIHATLTFSSHFHSTEHPAGAFGARHTPHIMRLHEIMGIESNRRWGVCNLNEFRKVRSLSYVILIEPALIISYRGQF